MKLTLLRHGQTEGSLRDLYYGATDLPVLPESLAALHESAGRYPTASRYYTSGLLRTEQTLRALYWLRGMGLLRSGIVIETEDLTDTGLTLAEKLIQRYPAAELK